MKIFRAYDIRGIYKKDIDEDIMQRIGRTFASYIEENTAVVGRDFRIGSPEMKEAFVQGVLKSGKNVIDVGALPLGTGMFHAWRKNLPFAYITASHLPKEWTGVKFFHGNGIGFMEEEGKKIKEIFLKEDFSSGKGTLKKEKTSSIIEDYKDYLFSKIKPERSLRLVLDPGNGAACVVADKIFKEAEFEVKTIFNEPDGNFPNRLPDPLEDPLEKLRELSKNADLGIAYDGDGDRMVVVDDKGEKLSVEQASFIMLEEILQKEKGPIIANVECTRTIDFIAKKFGRDVKRIKVGHTFLMEAVMKEKASFGLETSGHFVIPSLLPYDDSLAVSFFFACILSKKSRPLSELVKQIPRYPFERINLECDDERKFQIMKKITEKIRSQYTRVTTIDGVRVDLENGWVLIRPSNTSPVIRITVEADTEENLKEMKERFIHMVEEEIEKNQKA